jgi:cell division protein FtsL
MAAINHPLGNARRGLPIPVTGVRLNLWLILAIILASVGALLPVLENSLATSSGFDLQASQRQETDINGQVSVLESEVASLTSLARIQRRATEIGLGPVQDPIYVTVNEPGPAPAKLPSEYLPRVQAKPVSPSPWWKPLVDWLP